MIAPAFWALSADDAARALGVGLAGLTDAEAASRRARFGPNELRRGRGPSRARVLWRQLRSPLVLLLVFAAGASVVTGTWSDAAIVGAILVASVGVGYRRESRAETAIGALLDRVRLTAQVLRGGAWRAVALRDLVPGDLVQLSAGSIVPADALLVASTALHVDEAALTGESVPAAKRAGPVAVDAPLRDRAGVVYLGTNVRSGTARALVVATGRATAFGAIASDLATPRPETEFEHGLRRFGLLLLTSMLVLILLVFAVHMMLGRPPVETLLFSIALAVGLSPELLPAILAVNLSHAAQRLAATGVLCRRLDAIENLGSMTVLCTDKTGTLTEGVARVEGAYDAAGLPSPAVLELAAINAALQTGLANPIDAALVAAHPTVPVDRRKVGEIPYDFMRKRLGVVVEQPAGVELITKGSFDHIVEVCALDPLERDALRARYDAWCARGIRVIAVATRRCAVAESYSAADERELAFAGFVTFSDPPKPDAAAALRELAALGVVVKMVTGDSKLVATHVASAVGLDPARVLTGAELAALTEVALRRAARETAVFAEVDPNQKERILRALRRGGAVVGFFGDGVNDAPAMHAADVALSVDTAVDVAKATADLVLTTPGLEVIRRGIEHGRATFANTLKYILTTTSANLGNMISMAVASLVLPFLPLTAGQILLNNFLSDVPAIGIASDAVDAELVEAPRRWDLRFIGRFMLEFGVLSSAFDALTFVVLLAGARATMTEFRTAWFVESLSTELAIALVVRTRRRAWQSRPGGVLVGSSAAVAGLAFALPYLPLADWLGFTPLPAALVLAIALITLAYVVAAELAKGWFYRPRR